MTSKVLTQSEADTLFAMEKHRANDDQYYYPDFGGHIPIPLVSKDGREKFILDLRKTGANLKKGTYQNRARQVIILARLDFGGPPHRNPNNEEVKSPHIHLYKEGFGDKWAYPIPLDLFSQIDDPWQTLTDFMRYCNIVKLPDIQRGLFT